MKRKKLTRWILRIIGILLFIIIVGVTILFNRFFSPLTDSDIEEEFKSDSVQVFIEHLEYKEKKVRVIKMQETIDSTLATLIFVHGSPGSSMDFKRYLGDKELNLVTNVLAYDRVGYGAFDQGEILQSLEEEVEVMHRVIESVESNNIILIGYSYGGTTVMASAKDVEKKIILAAAVKGDLEPMFWALNLYKWNFTRPMVPKVFQAASEEKFRHLDELTEFENRWNQSSANVISIHGDSDKIVPYENSLFLKKIIDPEKYELVTLKKGTHSLIWTNFDFIKKELLKVIEQ